jgi:hypothetical protein
MMADIETLSPFVVLLPMLRRAVPLAKSAGGRSVSELVRMPADPASWFGSKQTTGLQNVPLS